MTKTKDTNKKIELGENVFFNELTGDYFETQEGMIADLRQNGWTEEEIEETLNVDEGGECYYTTFECEDEEDEEEVEPYIPTFPYIEVRMYEATFEVPMIWLEKTVQQKGFTDLHDFVSSYVYDDTEDIYKQAQAENVIRTK